MATTSEKARENRLRRMAERRGYLLVKCRRRDPGARGYGQWVLVEDKAGNRGGPGRHRGGYAALNAFERDEGDTLDGIEQELAAIDAQMDRWANRHR